ncbi:hypothetical protein EJV47_17860 [Hymenobacter gummosus]|uniref:Lipoprotein n=1 Tax=Hymenobacter gummosus TaxID=1776032 RepID=A0A431TZ99_9BACT|nr:hypothetical protein [Hymenobacter gummosus]RTQ47787.1 hypothetical protein EJV47_17860 [Hymenobacter gummosus]
MPASTLAAQAFTSCLLLLSVLAGCQPKQRPVAEAAPTGAEPAADTVAGPLARAAIHRQFAQWRQRQVRAGRLWAPDSCKPWLLRGRELPELPLSLPDSAEYSYSFADLNQDGRLDGLMTFVPAQCDGGTGVLWLHLRYEVLALSAARGYRLHDSLRLAQFSRRPAAEKAGFYELDSLGPNRLYATYLEFGPESSACCPKVRRPAVFDFAARRRLR